MNLSLSIHPPRWLVVFLLVGMLLVAADLVVRSRSGVQPTGRPATIATVATQPVAALKLPPDPRRQSFSLDCGCRVDYADEMSPPCSIWYGKGQVLLFDHLYRASSINRVDVPGVHQFGYDEQDRVVNARYDPESAIYYYNKDGSLKEIRHSSHGGRAEVIHPTKFVLYRGVRTRYPHKLPHPHVPPDSAMGHALAGTWKAFEKGSEETTAPEDESTGGMKSFPCGCQIDISDGRCSMLIVNGGIMLFDHLNRPDNYIVTIGQQKSVQFRYDDQDRAIYARFDPDTVRYHLDRAGKVEQIQFWAGSKPAVDISPSKARLLRGERTPRPDKLPHPHVPADSAMGQVLAGTWKPFEK